MPSLFDIVAGHAERDPDRLALLTERDGTRTYGELTRRSATLGAVLHGRLGLRPGARICVWAVNRPEWVETFLAAGAAGLATVSANPEWTDTEVSYVLAHSESVAVVCDGDLAERAVALARDIPGLEHVIALSEEGMTTPDGALAFEDLIAEAAAVPSAVVLPGDESPAVSLLMYTSGTTTGRPKAVVSHQVGASAGIDYTAMFGLSERDRAVVVTPFFHGNGFGGVASALAYGASAVFPRRFSASRFWQLVDTYRPTYLFTLAPIVNILMGRPPAWRETTHCLRVMIVLGAASSAPLIEERFGAPLIDWYGMTEAGMGTYTRLDEPRKPGSAGRPFPGSGMVILTDDGQVAEPGQVGEVVFKRDVIGFSGYLKDDEATAAALDAAYFHTGDLGYFDDDGYFFFVDRKKDIVRRGGENISSIEVEAALRTHPDVAEAAIIAAPDSVLGERVVAFVTPADPKNPPDPDAVKEHLKDRVAAFKIPEQIHYLPQMPRTSTGKIEKFRLRSHLLERVSGQKR